MKLTRRQRPPHEDSAALSDLAFLLIIYFIVIAGFNLNKGFLMNLPSKDSTRVILKDDLLRFELNNVGALVYQGETLDWSLAEREIRTAISSNPNLAVALSIDPHSPWQQVVSFVALAQRLEVETFSFSMKTAAEGMP
jgi:biopolymer transport protein ExbD